jgi:hypothetical protein
VEQTHRSALAHYDHRAPQMGQWVMIIAGWYYFGDDAPVTVIRDKNQVFHKEFCLKHALFLKTAMSGPPKSSDSNTL